MLSSHSEDARRATDLLTVHSGGGTAALFSAKHLGDNFAELRTNIQRLAASVKTNKAGVADSQAQVEVVVKDMESLDESLQRHRKRIKELAHNTGVLYKRLTALEECFQDTLDGPLAAAQNAAQNAAQSGEDSEPVAGTKRKRPEKLRDNNLQVSVNYNDRTGRLTRIRRRTPSASAYRA